MTLTRDQALTERTFHVEPCTVTPRGPRGGLASAHIEEWRRNGRTRTWKRQPDRWEIPVKHGMYAYGTITDADAYRTHVAEECPALAEVRKLNGWD